MDVHLLVYDLSQGLARQMSQGLLGFQLDAVYHTSIQLDGREYVYDGNIVAIRPGSSHLGQPMQKLHLGTTELPMDVIEEYLDSLREIYTVAAYDLWRHNCNNFSNDFATFLLGKGIPGHITNMPQAVLDSPFGQMIMPMLSQQINANRRGGGILGIEQQTPGSSVKPQSQLHHPLTKVRVVSNLAQLDGVLAEFQQSCAVIFFTSATCPPCKTLYPLYDELAGEVGEKGVLIKVDTSQAFDVGARYSISATPTFITFLKGQQENRWSGADPSALRGNIQLLVQMAWPPHPHLALNLPTFSNPRTEPVLFPKIPPLPKLLAKLGPTASDPSVQALKTFLETRSSLGPADAALPDLSAFTTLLHTSLPTLPAATLFPLIDLLRCALADPRVSGLLAEESPPHRTAAAVLAHATSTESHPYPLRLVTLQLACNLFSSPLSTAQILHGPALRAAVARLALAPGFLDDAEHASARVAAAGLLVNLAAANGRYRREGPREPLEEEEQVEIAAAVVQAVAVEEESAEVVEGAAKALGWLAYCMPRGGEVEGLLRAMEVGGLVRGKGEEERFKGVGLVREVGEVLLGEGLKEV